MKYKLIMHSQNYDNICLRSFVCFFSRFCLLIWIGTLSNSKKNTKEYYIFACNVKEFWIHIIAQLVKVWLAFYKHTYSINFAVKVKLPQARKKTMSFNYQHKLPTLVVCKILTSIPLYVPRFFFSNKSLFK